MGQALGGAALGIALGGYNDARQVAQQRRLQKLQMQGQREMGIFNREQAMKMWEDTNYAAQRKQMEKAGLNVGLMYGSAGAGGTTQGAGAGNVTGGNAPVGGGEVGMGIQLALLKAQKDNIEADTELKKTDATKKGGVDTAAASQSINESVARVKALAQQTASEKFKTEIAKWEEQLKLIEVNVADKNQHEIIEQMKQLTKSAEANAKQAMAQANVASETQTEVIKQIKQATTEQALRMAATRTGIQLTQEQITKVQQEVMNMAVGLSQTERKLRLEQLMTEFNIGGADKRNSETIKNYVNMLTDFIGAITGND